MVTEIKIQNPKIEIEAMEHSGAKRHRERLGEALREEISALVEGELGDPRIGLANVSGVQVAPDGRSARILISVEGTGEEAAQALQGLTAARNYIRNEVMARLRLRRAPELFFVLDPSQQQNTRVEELLKRIKKQNR